MYEVGENALIIRREGCSQLFVVFSGLMQLVGEMQPLDFLRASGLANRNIVLLRDPYYASYLRGISGQIPDLSALIAWIDTQRRAFSHVTSTYCVGFSAGGGAAMCCGSQLHAAGVWAFGPRPTSEEFGRRVKEAKEAIRDKVAVSPSVRRRMSRWEANLRTPTPAFIRWRLNTRAIDDIVTQLQSANGSTRFDVYYSPSNALDSFVVDALKACPGVHVHPVTPPPNYAEHLMEKPDWDHNVLPMLHARGDTLGSLFPAYESTPG